MFTLLAIVWIHFVADFLFQNDDMGLNKSSSFKWLTIHSVVYSIPLLVFGWKFALINGVAHWIVDGITSRITKRLWEAKHVRLFFNVIGLDQAIHMTILLLTANYLGVI